MKERLAVKMRSCAWNKSCAAKVHERWGAQSTLLFLYRKTSAYILIKCKVVGKGLIVAEYFYTIKGKQQQT